MFISIRIPMKLSRFDGGWAPKSFRCWAAGEPSAPGSLGWPRGGLRRRSLIPFWKNTAWVIGSQIGVLIPY
jgi:hypothetical protein